MKNNKPWTIKLILAFYIIRLCFIALTIVTFAIVKDIDSATRSVGAGIKEGIARAFKLDMSNSEWALGTLMGTNMIPVIITVLGMVFILNRKNTPAIVILVIDIFIGLSMLNPFLAIANIVLFFTKKSKEYMNGIDKKVETDLKTFMK